MKQQQAVLALNTIQIGSCFKIDIFFDSIWKFRVF